VDKVDNTHPTSITNSRGDTSILHELELEGSRLNIREAGDHNPTINVQGPPSCRTRQALGSLRRVGQVQQPSIAIDQGKLNIFVNRQL
jgi:hypothetical protein